MIETLSQALAKCRWLCLVILVAFSIENSINRPLVKEVFSEYLKYNNVITVINRTLTGVVVLSICILIFQKVKMNSDDFPTSILTIIEYADFKSVTEWTILFKWAFIIIQCNTSTSSLWSSIIMGFCPLYWIPIFIVAFALITAWLQEKRRI